MDKQISLKHYIDLTDVRNDDVNVTLRASEAECADLAKRLKIPEVTSLDGHLTIRQGLRDDLFDIEGHVTAKVIQECGVTLAPLQEVIDEDFQETLTTSEAALRPQDDKEDDDIQPVELIQNDRIDIGEIISQWVGLALNPYPRSDAPLFEHIEADLDRPAHRPFDILENLKGK